MVTHVPVNSKQYATAIGPEQPKTVHYDPNQYDKPIGPKPQSTGSKVISTVKSVASEAYDAGRQARQIGHDMGQGSAIRSIRSQEGFSKFSQQRDPRPRGNYPQQQNRPSGSPGETIKITRCDEYGNCRTSTLKGGKARQPRAPAWANGLLGGRDSGL